MKHYGDITKINGAAVEPVNVVCGGSPCQDLSVAGKRAGLAGERSGLFMDQIRIIKEMRANERRIHSDWANEFIRPRYMVWENVPGAFSSNGGEDFRAVLEETCRIIDKNANIPRPEGGKWSYSGCIMGTVDGSTYSVAWRTHDAQYWGVAQRRRRIALVADFGGSTAAEILFECKSVSGDIEPCGTPGENAADNAERCVGEAIRVAATITASYGTKWNGNAGAYSGENFVIERGGAISFQERAGKPGGGKGILIQNEHTGALNQQCGQSVCFEPGTASRVGGHIYNDVTGAIRSNPGDNQQCVCLNGWDVQSKHIQPQDGVAEALYSGECRGGGGESYVMQETPVCMETSFFGCTDDDKANILKARDYKDAQIVCLNDQGGSQMGVTDDVSGTLRAQEHGHQPVVFGISPYASNAMMSENPTSGIYEAETARTLDLNGGSPACNQGGMAVVTPISLINATRDDDDKRRAFGIGESGDPQFTIMAGHENGVAIVQGADMYNGQITGDVAATLNASSCNSAGHSGPSIVETYRKTAHPMNAEQGQGWEETNVNDTINCHDNGESRTPTLIVGIDTYNLAETGDVGRTLVSSKADNDHMPVILENHPADSRVKVSEGNVFQALTSRMGTGGGNVPMVMEQVAMADVANSLSAADGPKGVHSQMMASPEASFVMCIGNGQQNEAARPEKIAKTLDCQHDPMKIVSYGLDRASYNQGKNAQYNFSIEEERIATQTAKGPGAVAKGGNGIGSVVRRLTPMECERLQGFPDHWTDIGEWVDSNGKRHKEADSCRYKALGNSIALPYWRWMAKRMAEHLPEDATMASLFDGIGGFPLSFSEAGVKPIWASEIEEFPIAVTKIRFPEVDE